MPLKKQHRVYDEDAVEERPAPKRQSRSWREEAFEEDVEEPLFEAGPAPAETRKSARDSARAEETRRNSSRQDDFDSEPQRRAAEPAPVVRDKKGRFVKAKKDDLGITPPTFAVEDDDSRSSRRDDGPKFGRAGSPGNAEIRSPHRQSWRAEENYRDDAGKAYEPDGLRADRKSRRPAVVDADFEDVDAPEPEYYDDPLAKGFGRKVREDRRRQTALARLEDLEPVAERIFNEEFFTALRVQPKELERAIRKARRRAEAREKNRLTPLRALGWSAWVGAIAACAFVAYSYRNNIVAMFPNAKTAYAAVGIEANPYGLKIEGVTHRVAMSPEGPVIEILGRLRNEEKAEVAPPMLQAEAISADGKVLSRWTFAAQSAKVRSGETANFSTRAPAPDGVNEVLLSFAPSEGVKVSVGDLLKPAN